MKVISVAAIASVLMTGAAPIPHHEVHATTQRLMESCGMPPPMDVKYSSTFKEAVLRTLDRDASNTTDAYLQSIVDSAFIDFGFASTKSDVLHARTDISIDQAETLIESEYKNKPAQILAECGYRVCEINIQGENEQLTSLGLENVCTAALKATPGNISDPDVQTSPTSVPYIFPAGQDKAFYTVLVEYSGGGNIALAPSLSSEVVQIVSPHGDLHLSPGRAVAVKFQLTRPSLSQCSAVADATFRAKDNYKIRADVSFDLVHDSACMIPAQVDCGLLNENAVANAYSDVGGPPNTGADETWHVIPEGNTGFGPVVGQYQFNGGGDASVTANTSCAPLQADPAKARLLIEIDDILQADGGQPSGSGFGPGGDAVSEPHWKATEVFPGDPVTEKWTLNVDLNDQGTVPNRVCRFGIDGRFQAVSYGTDATIKADVLPGAHQLEFECNGSAIGNRTPNGAHVQATDALKISIAATRSIVGESERLGPSRRLQRLTG